MRWRVLSLLIVALCGCQTRKDSRQPPESTEPPTPSAESLDRVELERLDPEPEDCFERKLPAAVIHTIPLQLSGHDFLHLSVEQLGVDLVVRLVQDKRPALIFDSPSDSAGVEQVFFLAEDAIGHRIEIGAWSSDEEGAYRLCVESRRPATQRDRTWTSAVRAFYEARYGRGLDNDQRSARYRRAAELAAQVAEPTFQTEALANLGELELKRYRPSSAIDVLRPALEISQRFGDLEKQAQIHDLLGSAYLHKRELQASRQSYRAALATWRRYGSIRGEAGALSNLGLVAKLEDRYRRAVDRYRQAMVLWERIGENCDLAKTHSNLGTFYSAFDEHSSAWDHYRQAQSLLERCENEYIIVRTLPAVLTRMGDLLTDEGKSADALEHYQQALSMRRQAGDRSGEAVTLNSIALISGSRDPRAAFAAYRSALAIFRELGRDSYQATVLRNLAGLHERAGDLSEARRSNETALELARRADNHEAQALAQLGLARLFQHAGDLQQAEQRARQAVQLVDARHGKIARKDLRTSYLAHRQNFYDLLVTILAERHHQEPNRGFDASAFEVAESARARDLLGLVANEREMAPSTALDALAAEINVVHRDWLQTSQTGAPGDLKPLETDLRLLIAKHHDLSSRERSRFPKPVLPNLQRVQQELLGPDTLLLAYHLTDSRGWLWEVTPSAVKLSEIAGKPQIEAAVAAVLASDLRNPEAATPALTALADFVVAPSARQFDRRQLLITGPGIIQALPWTALPHPTTGRPLGLDREIVLLPSIAVLEALRSRAHRRVAGSGVAIVANAVFSPDDPRLPRPVPAGSPELPWLDPLPASLDEATAVARWLGAESKTFEGFIARRELLTQGRLTKLRLLHLATHTLLDVPDSGGDSQSPAVDPLPVIEPADLAALVFSRFDRDGRPIDGYLRAYEIRRLKLDVDLVVLSACRSVLGEDIGGEGLVGLAHAFLAAGARRVIASLWDVDDRATAALMERFYQGLSQGLPPDRALNQAQTALRQQEAWQAPHFWAGFALFGDASARDTET